MKMSNNNKKGLFFSKQVRSGGYSLIVTAIVIALAVFANLIVYTLPAKYVSIDVTDTGTFTLDAQSVNFVKSLDKDVTIYYICQNGYETALIEELLNRYTSLSSHISIKPIDPVLSPTFTARYTDETLPDNSLIVESSVRAKVISYTDMLYYYNSEYDMKMTAQEYQTYAAYYGITATSVFAGENKITSALDYVTAADIPVIYQLTGHGEASLVAEMLDALDADNFDLKTLDLLNTGAGNPEPELSLDNLLNSNTGMLGKIPEDADCIIINSPTKDLSDEELTLFREYVANGGNLLITTNYFITDLTNFISLASTYGLEANHSVIVDTDTDYYTQNNIQFLLPQKSSHEITAPLIKDNLRVVLGYAGGLVISETKPANVVSADSLLSTSADSYSKASHIVNDIAYDESAGDTKGPFSLGAAVATEGGKVVWFSSSYVCNYKYYGNFDLYLNSLGWMTEKPSSLTVRTISLDTSPLSITETASAFWSVVLIGIIPLAVLATGFTVWGKRRGK